MRAILADTETTGIDNPEVIELAFVAINDDLQRIDSVTVTRFKPVKETTLGALSVHHILPSELEDCIPASQAPKHIPTGTQYIIGHNIDFDWKALGSPPLKRICTLACSRHLWPEADSHSLTSMTYFHWGKTPATRERLHNAHSAEVDVMNNVFLFDIIVAKSGCKTLEELWSFSENARIPKVMTFGKHKGKTINEVDAGYANWYSKQPDNDPYLIEAFEKAGLLKRRQ